ncbi:3-hydroxyacyl-CoA dehydrogenase family protein [Risungbinella massiliensis]|uniref:3-hydroxyacyl-CoA dehydrogenase family protein n=1 Tax=Risungbinella massiliensis TaxID=1329796 RepID=UPI0005CB885D|nr:3-hydroxyacyl-CoA dehydrogenase family protein [Risungbinella massiliensis]
MTTTANLVLLVGQSPLYQELKELLEAKGYLVTSEIDRSTSSDLAIAIEVTNLELTRKQSLLQQLDAMCSAHVPILTTTLGVTATEAASWLTHPSRLVGFGTFVPLSHRCLIEVAPALQTDSKVLSKVVAFLETLFPEVEIVDDEVGLVFPRVLSLIINEAIFAYMEGTAEKEAIDTAMRYGTNYPMGPFEWVDQIGLDEVYAVIRGLHQNLGEERYRPAPLLRKMVLAGWYGERAGRGFYVYPREKEGLA